MSNNTKSINIEQDGEKYTVTITSIIDDQQVVNQKTLANVTELEAFYTKHINKALATQSLYETLAKQNAGEARAWFRELNKVNQNNYYAKRRSEIINWMQNFHWRYSKPGETPIDCEITEAGWLRALEQPKNLLRLTVDNKRKWSAKEPGGESFDVISADFEFWLGTDDNNVVHRIRKIKKLK